MIPSLIDCCVLLQLVSSPQPASKQCIASAALPFLGCEGKKVRCHDLQPKCSPPSVMCFPLWRHLRRVPNYSTVCRKGLSGERKAQLLEKLVGKDVGECPVCMDGAQDPVISLCAHGPFCRDCITTSLQHQVWTQGLCQQQALACNVTRAHEVLMKDAGFSVSGPEKLACRTVQSRHSKQS